MKARLSHERFVALPPINENQIDEFGHVSDVEFNIIGRKHALEWFSKIFSPYTQWCLPITKTKTCVYTNPLVLGAKVEVKTGLVSWDPNDVSIIRTTIYDSRHTYYYEIRKVKVRVTSPAPPLNVIGRSIGFRSTL